MVVGRVGWVWKAGCSASRPQRNRCTGAALAHDCRIGTNTCTVVMGSVASNMGCPARQIRLASGTHKKMRTRRASSRPEPRSSASPHLRENGSSSDVGTGLWGLSLTPLPKPRPTRLHLAGITNPEPAAVPVRTLPCRPVPVSQPWPPLGSGAPWPLHAAAGDSLGAITAPVATATAAARSRPRAPARTGPS